VSGRLKTFLTVAETRSIQLASKVLSDAGRQFTGRVKLSDLDPPNGYRLSGEGSGGLAGHAKGGATVRLFDDGKGTLMKYEAQADVGGKLAQLGSRLIDSAAKKLTDEFFEKFAAVVGPMPKEVGTAASVSRAAPGHRRGRSRGGRAAVFPLALRPGAARDFVGFTRCGAFD
jgi:carbon monoxide dehydrogenase subunit G